MCKRGAAIVDAISSAALYLKKHGWKTESNVNAHRSVLKRYNNLNIYANTILTLAESLRTGTVMTGPPDAPKSKAAPAKKSAAKKTPAKTGAKAKKAPAKAATGSKKAK